MLGNPFLQYVDFIVCEQCGCSKLKLGLDNVTGTVIYVGCGDECGWLAVMVVQPG